MRITGSASPASAAPSAASPASPSPSPARMTIPATRGRMAMTPNQRLAIRPEELNLGDVPDNNMLKGKVESVNFLGSVVRTRVDIGGATISLDLFNERKLVLPKIGDTVTVNFPSHACWTLD